MVNQVRRSDDPALQRVTTLELFYDLVFVFAMTRVSHLLVEHLTWAGAAQALIVLLAVWWSWNYTTWATNELNPESDMVRVLLIWLMLLSLVMSVAIPGAFGDHGLLFAGAYVAIQVSRHAFLTFAAARPGSLERQRAGRILTWFVFAGVFWIAGGLAQDETRIALWLVALALDYGAPLVLFWVPGRPHLRGTAWQVETGHFAERFGLFVIIALGETIVATGATTAEHHLTTATLLALVVAFIGTAALWWLYFTSIAEVAEESLTDRATRTEVARDVYTYGHVLIVAAIIVSAVGDELIVAHPTEELTGAHLLAVVAGPVLYLATQTVLHLRLSGHIRPGHVAGIIGCLLVGLVGSMLPALAVGALLVAVLVAVVVVDRITTAS